MFTKVNLGHAENKGERSVNENLKIEINVAIKKYIYNILFLLLFVSVCWHLQRPH